MQFQSRIFISLAVVALASLMANAAPAIPNVEALQLAERLDCDCSAVLTNIWLVLPSTRLGLFLL
jgi:hypothetical protein